MFPICKPHAAVLFHVPPPFLRCSFSLNTCICKKQPTNHENWGDKKSVLLPWHSLSAHDSMNSKCETYSLWARTIIKKVGEINRSPPALLEPPLQEQPCRWRTHVSCQRENTQINAFLQGLLIFFLGQLENPSQWCQIIPLCVPGDKKKIHPTAEIVSCSASSSNTLKGLSATCFSTKVNLVASFLNS